LYVDPQKVRPMTRATYAAVQNHSLTLWLGKKYRGTRTCTKLVQAARTAYSFAIPPARGAASTAVEAADPGARRAAPRFLSLSARTMRNT
jgi:hypothetical protein